MNVKENQSVSKNLKIERSLSCLNMEIERLSQLYKKITTGKWSKPKLAEIAKAPKEDYRPLSILLEELPSDLDDISNNLNNLINSIEDIL
jgi:hypothetical protein